MVCLLRPNGGTVPRHANCRFLKALYKQFALFKKDAEKYICLVNDPALKIDPTMLEVSELIGRLKPRCDSSYNTY